MAAKVSFTDWPKAPEKTLGSVDASYTNSPGSAQISATLPWSTISIHCPSATAMTEPLVITLSFPLLEDREETFFFPLTARTVSGSASQ